MLRTVMHPHPSPILRVGNITPASDGTATMAIGRNDVSSFSRSAAGTATIVWKQATNYTGSGETWFEAPIVGSTIQTSGTGVFRGAATAKSTISFAQAAGTDSIPLDYWAFTYRERSLRDDSILAPVLCNIKNPFIQAGKVVSNAISIGGRAFSITVNGTGDYTITFREAFGNLPVCGFGILTASRRVNVHSRTASSIRVRCTDLSNVAAASDFYFMALGSRRNGGNGVEGGHLSELRTHYREPRLLVFTVRDTGVLFGTGSATSFANNATGNNQFSLIKPFKQEPIVIGSAHGATIGASTVQIVSAQTNFLQYYNLNASGSGQNQFASLFVLGSDDASQYEA